MAKYRTQARPYAKAAFEMASEEHALQTWSEMLSLAAMIASDPGFQSQMNDPHFSTDQQVALFLDLGKSVFTPKMDIFMHLLGEFKRLELLPDIAIMYEEMKAEAEKVMVVELISAFPLSESEQRRFSEKLKARMHCNILLECATDNSIIGGAIIRAGDVVIDGSVRGRLNKLADSVGILN